MAKTIKDVTHIIVLIMLLFGIVLSGISGMALKNIGKMCDNNYIRNVWLAIFTFGVILITLSISYLTCMLNTSECKGLSSEIDDMDKVGRILFFIGLVISLLLIILSSVLIANVNKSEYKKVCGGKDVKSDSIIVLIVSIFSFIGFGLIIGGKKILDSLRITI